MNAPIQKHNHVMKPYACGEKLEGYIYIHMCVYVYVSICVCVYKLCGRSKIKNVFYFLKILFSAITLG